MFLLNFCRPTKGEAAKTKFKIFCRNWKKIDTPFKYEFRYDNGIKRSVKYSYSKSYVDMPEYPLWYEGYEPENKPSILPAGNQDKGNIIDFHIRIINKYGSYGNYSVKVEVYLVLICLTFCKLLFGVG